MRIRVMATEYFVCLAVTTEVSAITNLNNLTCLSCSNVNLFNNIEGKQYSNGQNKEHQIPRSVVHQNGTEHDDCRVRDVGGHGSTIPAKSLKNNFSSLSTFHITPTPIKPPKI